MPHFPPAHGVPTRTQQELPASCFPWRSQWNCTFTRLYLSVKISSPGGPTTVAVCEPYTNGSGVEHNGRKGNANGMHVNTLL